MAHFAGLCTQVYICGHIYIDVNLDICTIVCLCFFSNRRGGAGRLHIIHTHLAVCECVRPPADCGRSAGGKPLSAVQPCSDRRRHTLMKRFHIHPRSLCRLLSSSFASRFCLTLLLFSSFLLSFLISLSPFPLSCQPVSCNSVSLLGLCRSVSGGRAGMSCGDKSSIWVEKEWMALYGEIQHILRLLI